MTVVNKREPENPWDGVKLIVGVKRYYTENDNAVDDTYTQKVEAIRDKNVFLKAMAVQENREIYTQKFITKL